MNSDSLQPGGTHFSIQLQRLSRLRLMFLPKFYQFLMRAICQVSKANLGLFKVSGNRTISRAVLRVGDICWVTIEILWGRFSLI